MHRQLPHILAVLLISLLSILTFWPLVAHPATTATNDVDGGLAVWTIRQVQDNILAGRPIFAGNIFYPHSATVLFSDVFVTQAVLLLPLRALTQEPFVYFSLSIVLAQILTGVTAYWFLLEALHLTKTKQIWLDLMGALVFSFSTIHLRYAPHLHVLGLQFVLMSMAATLSWLRTRQVRWLFWVGLGIAAQVWQSLFLVYYIPFFWGGMLFYPSFTSLVRAQWRKVVWLSVFCTVLSLPLMLGYLNFYLTYHALRDIREVVHFSLLWSDLTGQFYSPVLFGVVGVGMFVWGWQLFHQNPSIHPQSWKRLGMILFGLMIVGFILALGPALHTSGTSTKLRVFSHDLHVPLPYTIFYYLAPGFKAFRTPTRFLPFSALMGVAGTIVVLSQTKAVKAYSKTIGLALIGLMLLSLPEIRFVHVPALDEYPAYVSFLAKRPERVVAVLPVRDWAGIQAKEDVYEMLYSLKHGKTLLNGQSGFFPQEWLAFQAELTSQPLVADLHLLQNRGIELAVVKKAYYFDQLTTISAPVLYDDSRVRIYQILRQTGG